MKSLLNKGFVRITLGVNIFKPKTLIKWLSELSQKFHFLLSYWQPAYSYGRTATLLMQTSSPEDQSSNHSAFQVPLHGPSALIIKKTSKTESEQNPRRVLGSFINSISVEKYKVRLFNGLYTFWENKRLRWGMLLLLIIAPLAKFFYLVLPIGGFGEYLIDIGPISIVNFIESETWFYRNIYTYFFSIGELLTPVLSILGIFLLFPKKYYPSYLVGVPFGYYLSMLVHRMFFVGSNTEFHSGASSLMTISFLLLGVVFFMVSDKVLFKQNHGKRAAEARIIGLINMPGMEWDDKEEILRKEVAEAMKVDNELFIKESA